MFIHQFKQPIQSLDLLLDVLGMKQADVNLHEEVMDLNLFLVLVYVWVQLYVVHVQAHQVFNQFPIEILKTFLFIRQNSIFDQNQDF
jgi:hypothetical protein